MSHRVTALGDTTSLAERKRNAGQRLFIGLSGRGITDDERRLIREIKPAGYVLFARNVEEPAQVRELNRELASLADAERPALRSLDQEGGRVLRVKATKWPSMRAVGRSKDLTAKVSAAIARELRAMAFDVNFAPVADVDSNPKNPIIGDRSFSASTAEVCAHVAAFIGAHQAEGIVACAKHFPGHGDTAVDSHKALPTVEREEADLREVELPPFKAAIDAGVGSIMTAHVIFSAFDEELPATLSPKVTRRLLRDEWKYDGLVFSDDLEMKAVAGRWTIDEIVAKTTDAGVDVLLCCEDKHLQLEAFESLVRAQEEDLAFQRACKTSAKRVMAVRERFLYERRPIGVDVVGCEEHRALAELARVRGAD